jgi:ribosome maturation factor RimP
VEEKLDNFSKIVQAKEIIGIAPKLLKTISNLDLRVVRIMMIEGPTKTLQFMLEGADLSDITIRQCTKVSRLISEILDEKDYIQGDYTLEVSSPGLERPIIEYSDYKRFIGSIVKIKLISKHENKIRFIGLIKDCLDGNITFIDNKDDKIFIIPITSIDEAKLVFNDF